MTTWRDLIPATKLTETELRRYYVAACTEAFTDARFFIRNVGNVETEGRHFKSGVGGQADVYGWLFRLPYPMEFEVELKNVKTPQKENQKAWAAYCTRNKIPYILLRAGKGQLPVQIIDDWVEDTSVWLNQLRKI